MRDYTLGETFDYKFTTCEPDTGAPITLAGTPVISAYVDNSTTQITAGITLTVDFDGVTGLHNVRVVATSGNGYTTGTNVALVITTGTVDAVSAVGYKVAEFTLGRAGTSNVTQWLGTAAATPTVAGVPEVDVTHWIGTAAATPTTAGVPEVDITFIAGAAVSTTTAQLGVNVVQISGDGTAADNLETAFDDTAGAVPWQGIIDQGTAQSATGTTLVLRAAAAFADDEIVGATIIITGGSSGVGQSRLITDYVSTTDTATVATWTTTPTGTITYKILGTAASAAGGAPTAAEVADAVWDEATSGHTTSGTFGEQVKTDIDAILVDTGTTLDGRLPAALMSGRMDASVGAMAANVITAAATAADFTTEVTAGVATAANLATLQNSVDDLPTNAELATALGTADDAVLAAVATVDTVVDAIKVQTDKFTNLPTLTAGGTGGQGYGAP